MSDADPTAGLPPQPDPPRDRRGKPVPQGIAEALGFLRILLAYGRHLADTLEHRATRRGFSIVAQCFGTAQLRPILVRLARGIMRAVALERVLLARAARGRDLVFLRPRKSRSGQPQTPGSERKKSNPGRLRRPEPDELTDLSNLPTLEQLEAEIRRHPIGQALADICSDLGITPGLCERRFGSELWIAMQRYRGNLTRLYKEFRRRQIAFGKELDRTFEFDWPDGTADGTRRQLGFFVGEEPLLPPLPSARPALAEAAAPRPP